MKTGIILTGLPASGKTTLGREIATHLGFSFLDKDDFLEGLFDRHGVQTWAARKQLSRQSDHDFQQAAHKTGSAVLVSHWRPLGANSESGTPTDWLELEYDRLVEVCCECTPEDAHQRFRERRRHPGHFDRQRDPVALAQCLAEWSNRFPIGIGTTVVVGTDEPLGTRVPIQRIARLLDTP